MMDWKEVLKAKYDNKAMQEIVMPMFANSNYVRLDSEIIHKILKKYREFKGHTKGNYVPDAENLSSLKGEVLTISAILRKMGFKREMEYIDGKSHSIYVR